MRLTDSGLDWLEKTHMKLAIGEPEKGSSRVRLTTWSDYQTIFHLYKVVTFVDICDICDKLSFTRVTIISCLKRNFKKTTTTKDYQQT